MNLEHNLDEIRTDIDNPILDDVEADALKAKASDLWTKHQKQLAADVPLADRFIWIDKDVASVFMITYGGEMTENQEGIPWDLLYDRNGQLVAYVREYKIEVKALPDEQTE